MPSLILAFEVCKIVKDCMENAVELSVPLRVKVSVGYDWANLKLLDSDHDTSEWKQSKIPVALPDDERRLNNESHTLLKGAGLKYTESIKLESHSCAEESTDNGDSLMEKLLSARSREAIIIDSCQTPNIDLENVARAIFGSSTP